MKPIKYRSPKELNELSKQNIKGFTNDLKSVIKNKHFSLIDKHFHSLHNEAFSKFNCIECANCCKTISPIITKRDIEKLSNYFRLKPSEFISKYLIIDEDNDFVFNQTPCPFLNKDNYCSIYQFRPKACCEYPHTDRRKIYQIIDITLKNCEICPVVYRIVDEIKNIPSLK